MNFFFLILTKELVIMVPINGNILVALISNDLIHENMIFFFFNIKENSSTRVNRYHIGALITYKVVHFNQIKELMLKYLQFPIPFPITSNKNLSRQLKYFKSCFKKVT